MSKQNITIELLNYDDLKKFKSSLSQINKIDLNEIKKTPEIFNKLSINSMCHFSLGLVLKNIKDHAQDFQNTIFPISKFFCDKNIDMYAKEGIKILKMQYNQEGQLRNPDLYKNLPKTKDEFIALGKLALEQTKEHGAFCLEDWQEKNWGCVSQPEIYGYNGLIVSITIKNISNNLIINDWLKFHNIKGSLIV